MTDGMDLGAILAQAEQMQAKMVEAQESQSSMILQGSAGGGKVAIDVDGNGEFKAVKVSPDVVDPTDVSMLEDLILAALTDASNKVAEVQSSAIDGLGMPNLGLGE